MIPPDAQRFMAKRAGATVAEAKGSHASDRTSVILSPFARSSKVVAFWGRARKSSSLISNRDSIPETTGLFDGVDCGAGFENCLEFAAVTLDCGRGAGKQRGENRAVFQGRFPRFPFDLMRQI